MISACTSWSHVAHLGVTMISAHHILAHSIHSRVTMISACPISAPSNPLGSYNDKCTPHLGPQYPLQSYHDKRLLHVYLMSHFDVVKAQYIKLIVVVKSVACFRIPTDTHIHTLSLYVIIGYTLPHIWIIFFVLLYTTIYSLCLYTHITAFYVIKITYCLHKEWLAIL